MKTKNLVHVGISGIPYGKGASINRCKSLYNFLHELGYTITCINNRAGDVDDRVQVSKNGCEGAINYIYTTPSVYRPATFLQRRFFSFIGRFREIGLILKLSFKKEIDVLSFYPEDDFFEIILYRLFSKIFGYPLVGHYVEYRSSFLDRNSYKRKIDYTLFDKYFMHFVDGTIPISDYLIENLEKRKKKPLYLKIPPVIDFDLFDGLQKENGNRHFLYVGSSGYYSAIELILSSFALIDDDQFYLYLILHGGNLDSIRDEIKLHPKKELIKVFSNLKYSDLLQHYKNANAVLIPLSDSLKDTARFPQKICEYLASKNPVITTNHGEVKNYFDDMENALVANNNDAHSFSEKMNFVVNNPQEASKIGLKGYETGLNYFNVSSYKEELTNFLSAVGA